MHKLAALYLIFLLCGCEKYVLDRQMEALCKKDGGVRVFETAAWPAHKFSQGDDAYLANEENWLGSGFRLIEEVVLLKEGDPVIGEGRLRRVEYKIQRLRDNKVMAQAVRYGRSGGDFWAVGHFSSKACPDSLASAAPVIKAVFIREK